MTTAQVSPFLVILRCTDGDQAGDGDRAAVGALLVEEQLADAAVAGAGQQVLEAHQRVVGDVEAEHLPLVAEQGHLVPLRRSPGTATAMLEDGGRPSPSRPPNRESWPIAALRLIVDVLVDRLLVDRDQRPAPVAHLVEGAGLDQRLDHPLVADQGGRPCP